MRKLMTVVVSIPEDADPKEIAKSVYRCCFNGPGPVQFMWATYGTTPQGEAIIVYKRGESDNI